MSDYDLLLGSTPGCAACADEEQRGHDGMCNECRKRRWRESAEFWSRRTALAAFGEVIAWIAALQMGVEASYTCTECGHVGSGDDPPSPDGDKLYCDKCWNELWSRRLGGEMFARGIAAAIEAEDAAYAGNWRRMPCDFCESADGEMPVHDAKTGGKMHAKCAHMERLYRERAALVDLSFTGVLTEQQEERLAAVRKELEVLESEQ